MSYELMAVRGVSNQYGARDTGGSDGFVPSAGLTRELALDHGGPLKSQTVNLKAGWSVNDVADVTFYDLDGNAYAAVADTAFTKDVVVEANTGIAKVITVTQTLA